MIRYAMPKYTQQIVILSYENDLIIIDKKGNYNRYHHKYYSNNIHAYKSVQIRIDEEKLNNKTYVKCLYNRIMKADE